MVQRYLKLFVCITTFATVGTEFAMEELQSEKNDGQQLLALIVSELQEEIPAVGNPHNNGLTYQEALELAKKLGGKQEEGALPSFEFVDWAESFIAKDETNR